MKTGPERPRLSARLAAMQEVTETQAQTEQAKVEEAAALMASTLETFRQDCESSLKSALNTIEADMAGLLQSNRRAIIQTLTQIKADLNLIRRLTRFGPWALAISLIMMTATIFAVSWFWGRSLIKEARDSSLMQIGIVANQTKAGLVLSWDTGKLRLNECRSGSKPVPCLIPAGEN